MRPALVLSSCALFLVSAASALGARPDLNSFVNHKITDTSSLIAQVRTDPQVSDRYQRHFAMNRGDLVAYLGGLHRATLAKDGMYTIYSVPQDGHLKMHIGKLKKGSAVFMDKRGATVLVAKCGNPVVLGPVRVARGNPLGHEGDEMDARQLPGSDLALGMLVDGPNELASVMPDVPETAVEDVPGREIRGGSILFPPGVPAAGGAFSLGALGAGLASLGAVDLSLNNGGGGISRANPVPEPSAMAALGLGALALVRRRRKA